MRFILFVLCLFFYLPGFNQSIIPSVKNLTLQTPSENQGIPTNQIVYAYSPGHLELPIRLGQSAVLKRTNQQDQAHILYDINPQLNTPAEGYQISIKDGKISLHGKDQAGLFYAFITLSALLEEYSILPNMELVDYPSIGFRPIHVDVKHHLEKKEYYYDLIDFLAQLKINGIILELEDKIKYTSRPEIASKDAFSIEEWKDLCDYAIQRNISISPLVQGLGHASYILKHSKYQDLRDDPESDWAFNPLDPLTYELQFDLYRQAMEATPHGKYLHVGGDEVHTTGRESGQSALELNLIWLNKVSEFAAQNGRIPIFWDDMPLKQAELYYPMFDPNLPNEKVDSLWMTNKGNLEQFLDRFPKNCIYMRWNYSHAETYGNDKAMQWFTDNGLKVMGATAGQTRWTLMPRSESNLEQIQIFAQKTLTYELEGLLLTLWDDDSPHFELYKRGITGFGIQTWEGGTADKETIKSQFRKLFFGPHLTGNEWAFIDDLEEVVDAWIPIFLKKGFARHSLLRDNNKIEAIINLPDPNTKGAWSTQYAQKLEIAHRKISQLQKIESTIDLLKKESLNQPYTLAVYEQVVQLTKFSFNSLLLLEAYDQAKTEEESLVLLEKIQQLPATFRTMRREFERVYGHTRVLEKPKGYQLDQDHHNHPANQSVNFDWQFFGELFFLEQLQSSPLMAEAKTLPKIAIAGLAIESSTFSPARTAAEAFHAKRGNEIFNLYPFMEATSTQRNVAEWIPILKGHALPGGMVTRAAYESLLSEILDGLGNNLPLDGLFFDIHGAMSVEGLDDPEGDMIERIRAVIGDETLISTSMDLHGNVSEKLAGLSDLITCYRMAPHEDAMESKQRAVDNLLERIQSGKGRPPFKARIKVPILLPGEKTSTRVEPGKSLYAQVDPLTKKPGIVDAAIWMGYPWADEPRNHGVVMVVGDDQQAVENGAEQLAKAFWEVRNEFEFVAPTTTLNDALNTAFEHQNPPFFISDMGDNPTAGGAGDVTWTLHQILQHPVLGKSNGPSLIYASIPGPDITNIALEAGIGAEIEGMAGAAVDNRYAPPITLKGKVHAIKKGDRNAVVEVVLKINNNYIIVTEKRKPYHYLKDFTDLNLNPQNTAIVMVKIGYLVPELYQIQKGWLMALTPGGVDQDLVRLPYKRLERPIFPLDQDMETPNLKAVLIPSATEYSKEK
jgi:microcystin degradation protein MlrC